MEINFEELIEKSFEAQKNSYAPYSNFHVGASLLTKSGKIFCGCNIENASYSVTICAERVAMSKAISEGEKDFEAICITCSKHLPAFPCGVCIQFMTEFSRDMKVVIATSTTDYKVYSLNELLPYAFDSNNLN